MRGLGRRIWQVSQKKCFSHHNLFVSPSPVFLLCLCESRIASTSCLSKTDPLLEDLLFLDNWSQWGLILIHVSQSQSKSSSMTYPWSYLLSHSNSITDEAHSLSAPLISSGRNFFISFNLIFLWFVVEQGTRPPLYSVYQFSLFWCNGGLWH